MAAEGIAAPQLTVLMTADAVGGVWQYSLDLAAGLAIRGVAVHLASMGPRPTAEQRRAVDALDGIRLHESDWDLEWMPGGIADLPASADWLLELQAKTGARLVHLNGYSHAACDWPVPAISVAHSCVFSWWRAVHGTAPGPEWQPYQNAVSAGLARASAVVAPSRAMAKALEIEYAVERSRSQVICNATRVAADDGSGKQPYALAAGRLWDKAKNLSLLHQIAPQLDWPVRIAGPRSGPDGSVADSPPDRSAAAAEAGAVQTIGPLSHSALVKKMRAASLFLHPALYEPFGLTVLEAARSRCCLVLADIPSLRELWDGCAEFVAPQDAEQWTFEVNRLIRNRSDREKFAQRAAANSHRYQPERMISQYLDLYQSLLSRRASQKEGAAA